ncbi:hypothetical protein SPF06_21850 [Sinomonas sp. JGH33]|uniref:Uncharacterized protein n=1 Tax=Sinomonas terricola TaxID=3110330 RepID=A0ABU5TCF4_9MICC|nr:hypothetical protein [Sinomonas sp. JGH33]MEA5457368.1 hypothetical protein [Sinomonas sp. JGH33]
MSGISPVGAARTSVLSSGSPGTIGDQARAILHAVLESPGLADQVKLRLRVLVAEHESCPEMALLEHLRELRATRDH